MAHDHEHEHGCSDCSCCDHHDHDERNTYPLHRALGALALMALALWTGWAPLHVAAYLLTGADVVLHAARQLAKGRVFDEHFLMAVASLGAMLLGEYAEGVAVMALYQAGEWLQDRAVDRSRASIAALMDIRPDSARVIRGGMAQVVDPRQVQPGEVVEVNPGERIPLDGVLLEGETMLGTEAVTGESTPRRAVPGDEVLSGCVNHTGVIRLQVSAAYGQSTVARILQLVEESGQRKARTERFISRFARVYTPVVCTLALLVAVVPPLVDGQWLRWVRQALTFLVVSCPCALVISVPMTFYSGLGGASRKGVIVKGAGFLEALSRVHTVAFDKTGTLTCGEFAVREVHAVRGAEAELLELAALAEAHSAHPIARSLKEAWGGELLPHRVASATERAGHGVTAQVDGRTVLAGSLRLMQAHGVTPAQEEIPGTVVHVAADGEYRGYVVIDDAPRPTASAAVNGLKALGVRRLVMLTGDREPAARRVADQLGLAEVHAELLPVDKVRHVEQLLGEPAVAFVGDGVNDAPVLRRSDVGVAMGGMSSDAAVEAADVVLMHDDPALLAVAIRHARRTMGIVGQNIALALALKAAVLALSFFGAVPLWLAVFADVGVCLLAVLNALRAMR